jgi:hypothetical protein
MHISWKAALITLAISAAVVVANEKGMLEVVGGKKKAIV